MSGESTDSESTPSDHYQRSRSLLRQVRASLTGRSSSRHAADSNAESSSVLLLRTKRPSLIDKNIDKGPSKPSVRRNNRAATPVSFSHRLNLLNQVKSHLIGSRKQRQTAPSTWYNHSNDYKSLPSDPLNIEVKPSPTTDDNQTLITNESNVVPPDSPINAIIRTNYEKTMVSDSSPDNELEDHEQQRLINGGRLSLYKFKDQFTQRARTVMTKSSSLSSILTNTSATNPQQVFWTEVCIDRGKDLSVKDLSGTSDPYVKVLYGTEEKYTSNTISKTLHPIWNERFTFFTDDLNIPVYFHIFDHDRIGRDEPMGSAKLELWRLPLETVYNVTLELEDEKRSDGKTGSLKISISLTPKSVEFRDEVLRNLAKQQMKSYLNNRSGANNGVILARRTIDVFVIEGRNLATLGVNKLSSPYLRLKFGANKKFRTQTIKNTFTPKWHQSFMYDTTQTDLPPLELTLVDDASSSGDFLGRGVCNLSHLTEERTHRIRVDLEDDAGTIDLFVTITGTTPLQEATNDGDSSANVALDVLPGKLNFEEIEHYRFKSTLRSMNPISDVGKLEIKIYQARDLSAKDITGKSDPFCIVELDTNRLRTHTIYKTLDPVWNKSFIVPVQDIHSVLEISIYDEDTNKSNEFIGKVAIPLLAIKNGEKKWVALKDRKCLIAAKGAIEVEATFIYNNVKAVIRTFNPRIIPYYQTDGKFSVGAIKQHVTRIQNMLKSIVNVFKFINYCFQWENPWLSFTAFMASLIIVWNFELYMLPCTLLLMFARNAVKEYRQGILGKPFANLTDDTIASVAEQPAISEEEILEGEVNTKEQKKSFVGFIHGLQDTILEIQGYIDGVASTLERIKNVFNFTVPWLSVLLIIVLALVSVILYYIPLRYLILAFVINKFTKRFRKPKGYIDNNEVADFISRLPSDPELMQYRELKPLSRLSTPKKNTKRSVTNGK